MTDARVSRADVETLVAPTPTGQVSRVHADVLVQPAPDEQVSRAQVEVLYQEASGQFGSLSGSVSTPVASMTGAYGPTGTVAGQLPTPTADLAGDVIAIPPITGSLSGQLPTPTAALDGGHVSPDESVLDGWLPLPTLALNGAFIPLVTGSVQMVVPRPSGTFVGSVVNARKPTRWVLRDPASDETWTFPVNPNKMTSPHAARSFNILATAPSVVANGHSRGGLGRVIEGNPEPYEWSFSGFIREQQHFEDLLYWTRKVNRLELTDHLGRTWRIRFLVFNPDEQRPTARHPWRFTYDVKALNYGAVA